MIETTFGDQDDLSGSETQEEHLQEELHSSFEGIPQDDAHQELNADHHTT